MSQLMDPAILTQIMGLWRAMHPITGRRRITTMIREGINSEALTSGPPAMIVMITRGRGGILDTPQPLMPKLTSVILTLN